MCIRDRHIHLDSCSHTVFEDNVAIMAMHATEEGNFHFLQNPKITFQAFFYRCHCPNIKLFGESIFIDQIFHSTTLIINDCGRKRLERMEIPLEMCIRDSSYPAGFSDKRRPQFLRSASPQMGAAAAPIRGHASRCNSNAANRLRFPDSVFFLLFSIFTDGRLPE